MNEYITAQQVANGKPIRPIDRIKLMSPNDWEIFIEEWLDTKKEQYLDTNKLGGAGDMGRDVVAYITNPRDDQDNYQWNCYQCKHYDHSLSPSDIWSEFGKIIYYSYKKEYPIPQKYYFIAPHGIGTKLSNLLKKTNNLKEELKKQWDKNCKKKITDTQEIDLTDELLGYFEKFDFSIFDSISPKNIIEEHKKHPNHLLTFGGGLPARASIEIPEIEQDKNLRYITQLLKAYDSDVDETIKDVEKIPKKHQRHFSDTRKSFYKAEELRVLTRDNLSLTVFENLKNNIYDGVINTVEDDFTNGYKKAKAVEDKAVAINIESNPLREVCETVDKKGICHHLVNDEKISWIDDE